VLDRLRLRFFLLDVSAARFGERLFQLLVRGILRLEPVERRCHVVALAELLEHGRGVGLRCVIEDVGRYPAPGDAAIERVTSTVQPAAKGFYAIDIPELCLRNISALLPQDDKGVAMLALNESYAQLVTTRQGVMYLTRRIDTARRFEPHEQSRGEELDAGALALELQRSLDYYESHYDQSPIGDLVIAPGGERAQRVAAALRNETSLRVAVLDVREFCNVYKSGELVTDWPSLMALGAALRTQSAE